LALDDDRCCLVAYDEDNNLRAMLESTGDELYEWGKATYEQYRAGSVPLAEFVADAAPVDGER
jgi:hypothetical protein